MQHSFSNAPFTQRIKLIIFAKKKKIHVNIKYACLIDKIGMP
jgi:hypothetical protein